MCYMYVLCCASELMTTFHFVLTELVARKILANMTSPKATTTYTLHRRNNYLPPQLDYPGMLKICQKPPNPVTYIQNYN